jgi:hypothetical protein
MSVTWGTFKASLARRLGDTTYDTYSEALLKDAVNAALEQFATLHTGVASTFDLSGDGSTYEYSLPSDIIESEGACLYAVHWKDQIWLRRIEPFPSTEWPSTKRSTTSRPAGYMLWPASKINLTRTPEDGQTVELYYVAHYPEVVDDDTLITVPRWAREPVTLYCMAIAAESIAMDTGELAQYKSRRDSGDPEDNPLLRLAEHYIKRFYHLLSMHPVPQYAKTMPVEPTYG